MIADSATLATTPLSPRGVLSDMENGVITMSGVANVWWHARIQYRCHEGQAENAVTVTPFTNNFSIKIEVWKKFWLIYIHKLI